MRSHIFGGSMIVAGTAIGAGMLALPVVTAEGGFMPSLLIYGLCYFFMLTTGLLIAELCLKAKEETNLISIASHYLGRWGRGITWILYLFLFYSLSVAYISVGGDFFHEIFGLGLGISTLLFVLIFGSVVYVGVRLIDRCNLFLIAGLIVSYCLFLFFAADHIEIQRLLTLKWPKAFLALPVIFTSFSYQGTVPSLVTYLQRDARKVRWAIVTGTTVIFIVYVIFQFFILGILPLHGADGLLQAKREGATAIAPLSKEITRHNIYLLGQWLSFFAITTSFLGVNLGLFDFLADGLKLEKKGMKKVFIALITFLPPLLITLGYPHIFLIALNYAGGVGCALLLGLLPALFAWLSRYYYLEKKPILVPGGKSFLFFLFAFVAFELVIEGIGEFLRFT